ncbi:MAG: type II toxin-antitoxin system VapC family toxin, partial [Bifidobacteriaceae bacterium]|nr:type II toxin-antitoxin system VapC family toxin [Bifidobacteriaceae bacterium]
MLDTNICSFLMRARQPVLEERVTTASAQGALIVISAITYAELRYGATGPKASPRHVQMVDEFAKRLDAILPWDAAAVEQAARVRRALRERG